MKHLILALALLVFSGASASADASLMAMQPQIKLGIGARPAVMFVEVHNKGAATQLVGAESDAFARIELHTHEMNGAMMRMVEVAAFDVPAKGKLRLAPGGHHLMMFGFRGEENQAVAVTLRFANGEDVTVTAAPTRRAKAGHQPKHDKPHHHGH